MIKAGLQLLIKAYQKALSPLVGNQCRFYPTCSCYAHEALEKHGVFKGLVLTSRRLIRCNPWLITEWTDPVPDQFALADLFRYKRPGGKTPKIHSR